MIYLSVAMSTLFHFFKHNNLCFTGTFREQQYQSDKSPLFSCFQLSLVVVCNAVDVAVLVHSERHPVQSLGAHHTAEAAGVVRVPKSLQDLRITGQINNVSHQIFKENQSKLYMYVYGVFVCAYV